MSLQPAPRRAEEVEEDDFDLAIEPVEVVDPGELPHPIRQVVVKLVQGPYLRADQHQKLWAVLEANEQVVRTRLADLYLDLIIDHEARLAFVRHLNVDNAVKVIRNQPLTLLDTVLVLYLRRLLLQRSHGSVRVFVGRDEMEDQLRSYRPADRADKSGFDARINAAISKMDKYNVLLKATGDDDRWEVSPILALAIGADQVAAINDELLRLAPATDETEDDA